MTPATLSRSASPLVEQLLEAVTDLQFDPELNDAGNGNGNGHRNGKGNGHRNGNGNGSGHAPSQAELSRAQARRVATRVGRGMLVATTNETAEHSDDVVVISRAICDLLEIRGEERQDLLAAAHLHDIGKAAIPAEIINKPGPLNSEEWELMREHTAVGADILASVTELQGIAEVVRHSHERWDGQGYPVGLAGEEIPLGSRIIFCADAFHAIRSDRPYRPGRPAPEVLIELRKNAGTQFDPTVIEALEEAVRDLRMVGGPRRVRRSSRLMALLLCLGVGFTGSAIARSGLLEPAQGADSPSPAALHSSGAPAGLLGLTFAEEVRLHQGLSLSAGLGSGHTDLSTAPKSQGAENGAGETGTGETGSDEARTPPTDSSTGGPSGNDSSHGGSGNSGQGNGNSSDSKSSSPVGSAPGNSGNNPHGGPPGLSDGGPPGQSGASTNSSGNANGPGGGDPPGQAKKN